MPAQAVPTGEGPGEELAGTGAPAPLADASGPAGAALEGGTAEVAPVREKAAAPSLIEIARERLRQLTKLLKKGGAEPDEDFVHDLRVSTRRLAEVTRLLENVMNPKVAEAVVDSLRRTRQAAGELRDLDVLAEHLRKWRMPTRLKRLRQTILGELPARRELLVAHVKTEAKTATFTGCLVLLASVIDEQAGNEKTAALLAEALTKRIRRRRRQLRGAFAQAAQQQTSEAFHQARIGVKKLRYALELAVESGMAGHAKELRFLKNMQAELGDMHDTDVIVGTLQGHMSELQPARRTAAAALRRDWRRWIGETNRTQAKRAAEFFKNSYMWMNNCIR